MLTNQTPLPALARAHRDHLGQSHILVIAKGAWLLSTGRMAPAEQQVGLHMQPVKRRIGDLELAPAQRAALHARLQDEVIWLDHDLAPPKPACDVMVAGYATAPFDHPHPYIDAGVRIGDKSSGLRAFAPRFWQDGWLGHKAKALATTVQRVPLSYAFADWPSGFAIEQGDETAYLPWIEALHADSRRRSHARVPAGFGFWPENAVHRSKHSGTFDDAWLRERSPDLPTDFNPRFYNAAHPELQLVRAPQAGTAIRLVHLARQAIIDCTFPALALAVQARTAAGHMPAPTAMTADTIIIEPDHDRLSIIWRALVPSGQQADAVRSVRLFKTANPAA
ncbi:DUF2169 domain-containing protein [Massilia sp. CCM 9210]|uniref:DUF2169 family type VI secretion system accessory protein n=1 Tax=Massilia scottii TaxID=3057166 RepID=UPI0027964A0F|nr:DUF2169 domain-containing protein [Massilia sp. CCM 9210]MDQ1815668.1 DUF2169 domain-containing protein [Massilia sp. CCM 9210]